MQIEIVEFYPNLEKVKKVKNLYGTLHVYIIEDKIDLRGIRVYKNKNLLIFHVPSSQGIDQDTGQVVYFPVFAYQETEKNKELLREIITHGTKYIQKIGIKE